MAASILRIAAVAVVKRPSKLDVVGDGATLFEMCASTDSIKRRRSSGMSWPAESAEEV